MRTLPRFTGLLAITIVATALTGCAEQARTSGEESPAASASATSTQAPATTEPGPKAALSCPDNPRTVSPERIQEVFALASDRLNSAAQERSGYPIGALAAATNYERTKSTKWTAGFFPAELWLMARATGEPAWQELATQWSGDIPTNAQRTDTHDLGFLVGLPMDQAAEANPADSQTYNDIANTAAQSLSQRWNANVGAIQSGEYDGQWGVIVDSAMNVPLLIAAGQRIGGAVGDDLVAQGTRHLAFLADQFVRPNGSTIHRQIFDTNSGANLGPVAGQGENPNSTWSRGQAWAIHGFTDGYALTQDPALLDAAHRTTAAYIEKVPAGCIPTWDLDVVNGPANTPLDASAAAIVCDGLLKLADLEPDEALAQRYRDYALITLNTLTNERSLTTGTSNPGILLRQTYNVNENPESGSYVWGDTYLLLALLKAQGLGG